MVRCQGTPFVIIIIVLVLQNRFAVVSTADSVILAAAHVCVTGWIGRRVWQAWIECLVQCDVDCHSSLLWFYLLASRSMRLHLLML
jgi:hypothetical protein